ncbi:hypothetical protein AAY473_003559 [Plecturocebus cupreus]
MAGIRRSLTLPSSCSAQAPPGSPIARSGPPASAARAAGATCARRHAQGISVFPAGTEFRRVGQAGLQLPTSGYLKTKSARHDAILSKDLLGEEKRATGSTSSLRIEDGIGVWSMEVIGELLQEQRILLSSSSVAHSVGFNIGAASAAPASCSAC